MNEKKIPTRSASTRTKRPDHKNIRNTRGSSMDDRVSDQSSSQSDQRPVQVDESKRNTDPLHAIIPEQQDEKSDLIKYGELLTNKQNERYLLERLTELKAQEIKIFSIYLTYAEKYDIECIKDILYMQMSLNFSKGRKRVSELVKLFQSAERNDEREMRDGMMGIVDRFRRK
jgi:hypothetical protein